MMKRLVSGLQPTGELHIGSYLGTIKQLVELQHEYQGFFFVADYHALTVRPSAKDLKELSLHVAAMMVALGVDPKVSTVFLQSMVPEHTELSWILGNYATIGDLNRMTQYKEKSNRYGQYVGLFTYPVLMASDIIIYNANLVPVGDDQVQHLELAREIVRRFNQHYQADLVEPKPLLTKASRIMALNDPTKKMGKSIPGSAIGLLDDENKIIQTIKHAVTDSDPNSATMSSAIANLFQILEGFSTRETHLEFEKKYREGKLKYVELKEQLTEDILDFIRPVQKTYRSLRKNDPELVKMLEHGSKDAREVASETLKRVKNQIGLVS